MATGPPRVLPDEIASKDADLSWETGGATYERRKGSGVRLTDFRATTRVQSVWRTYVREEPSDKEQLLPKSLLLPEVSLVVSARDAVKIDGQVVAQ